jgi:hypothetical protein
MIKNLVQYLKMGDWHFLLRLLLLDARAASLPCKFAWGKV